MSVGETSRLAKEGSIVSGNSSTRPPPEALDLASLFLDESRSLAGLLKRLGVPKDDLADVVQETFLRALRFRSQFDVSRPGRPWLFAIARREAANHGRTTRRLQSESDIHLATDPTHSLVAANLVAMGLAHVAAIRRSVFEQHELLELPLSEVAKRLGISLSCAYARYRLARKEFLRALQQVIPDGF